MVGPVNSVSKAFAILRILNGTEGLTLSEVARAANLGPSSCHNLLKTLVAERVADRDDLTKRYKLAVGWRTLEGSRQGEAARLIATAQPLIARLAQSSEVAAGLWMIVSRDRMQLIARAESDAGMRLSLADDQRQPLGAGAAGRAMAALDEVSESELKRRFAMVHWQVDLRFADYKQQIADAAKIGFAIDPGTTHRGVCTVAVGIADVQPGFCVSASFVSGSRGPAEVRMLGFTLMRMRDELTKSLD